MSSRPRVAALYIERGGVYWNLPDVDAWDAERDARKYAGPWPVVAHPPCARWSIMGLCRGYGDGADDGCFAAALDAVCRFGGVLEHPRYSLAWKAYELPRPVANEGWTRALFNDGWACEVDQRLYGHPARKLTWLYYVGPEPPALRWGVGPAGRTVRNDGGGHTRPDGTYGSRSQRSRTPLEFRDELIGLAQTAARVAA